MFLMHKILSFKEEVGIHLSHVKTMPIRSRVLIQYTDSPSPVLPFCRNTLLTLKLRVCMLSGSQEGGHGSFTSWLRMSISGLLGKEPHFYPHSAADLSASLGVKQGTNNSDKKLLVPHYYGSTSLLVLDSFSGWLKWQVSAYHTCRVFTLLTLREKLGPVHSLSYQKLGTASFAITSLQDVYPPPEFGNTFWLLTVELLIRHLNLFERTLPLLAF